MRRNRALGRNRIGMLIWQPNFPQPLLVRSFRPKLDQHESLDPSVTRLGNMAVTKSLIFVIDNRRAVGMLVAMSADIVCSAEAADGLRSASASALGIWR